jgi:hypothetical protein
MMSGLHAVVRIDDCAGSLVGEFRFGHSLDANNQIDTSAGKFYKDVQVSSTVSTFTIWANLVPGKGYYSLGTTRKTTTFWSPGTTAPIVPPRYIEVLLFHTGTETVPVTITTQLFANYFESRRKLCQS